MSTWRTSSAKLNYALTDIASTNGSYNNALITGGTSDSTGGITDCFTFDGITCSSVSGRMNISRKDHACIGTRYSAIVSGGGNSAGYVMETEKWNGSSWSTVSGGHLFSSITCVAGFGSASDAIICGGYMPSSSIGTTHKFNGTTMVELDEPMTRGRKNHSCVGSSSSSGAAFGTEGSGSNSAEEFNGSSWSSIQREINWYATFDHASTGSKNSSIITGGTDGSNTINSWTKTFNGTTCITDSNMLTTRYHHSMSGYSSNAAVFGGYAEGMYTRTDSIEINVPPPSFSISVPNMSTNVGTSTAVTVSGTYDRMSATSSNTNVATVSYTNKTIVVTGVSAGVANINVTAYRSGYTNAYATAVATINLPTFSISTVNLSLEDDGTTSGAIAYSISSVDTLTAVSSNTAIATVAVNGTTSITVNGISPGACTITLTAKKSGYQDATKSINVTVNEKPTFTFSVPDIDAVIGESNTYNITDALDSITAVSSDTSMLTISVSGKSFTVVGLKEGTATITFTAVKAGYKDSVKTVTTLVRHKTRYWNLIDAKVNSIVSNTSCAGSADNAIKCGGYRNSNSYATSETFNGMVWSLTNNLACERDRHVCIGNPNNAMVCGGDNEDENYGISLTELFDGTTWSTINESSIISKRVDFSGAGIANNAIVFGGSATGELSGLLDTTEKFNGSTWSLLASTLNTGRSFSSSAGISNSAMTCGGHDKDANRLNTTEKYNGISWTMADTMNVVRGEHACTGTSNDAMICGGNTDVTDDNTTEIFYSTTWSILNINLNIGRSRHEGAGNTSTSMICGGNNSNSDTTEIFSEQQILNFTVSDTNVEKNNFTIVNVTCSQGDIASLAIASSNEDIMTVSKINNKTLMVKGISEGTASLQIIGTKSGYATTTIFREVKVSSEVIRNWYLLDAKLNTARYDHIGVGTSSDAIVCGGNDTNVLNTTESFNGTVWSLLSATLNTAREEHAGVGISKDAIACGGREDTKVYDTTESFNGTTWSLLSATLNAIRTYHTGVGTSNDAIVCGGFNNGYLSSTESFNGTTWSLLNANMNTANGYHVGVGISNDAMVCGGYNYTDKYLNTTESFNGTTWTVLSATLNTARDNHTGVGTSKDAMICGGRDSTNKYLNTTESFNGTTWSLLSATLNTARDNHTGVGTSNDAMICGGYSSTNILNTTERYGEMYTMSGITIDVTDVTAEKGGISVINVDTGNVNNPTITAVSSNEEIFTVTVVDNSIIITGVSEGTADLTITVSKPGYQDVVIVKEVTITRQIDRTWILVPATLNIARAGHTSIGCCSDVIMCGGANGDTTFDTTEAYNGTVWSLMEAMLTIKREGHASVGISKDAIACGGRDGVKYISTTEKFNGTVWTLLDANINMSRRDHTAVGISTNAIMCGGNYGAYLDSTEHFDGTVWTTLTATLNTGRDNHTDIGNANDAMICGGYNDNYLDTSESFNGTVWTVLTAKLNSVRNNHVGVGISKDAMVCGGNPSDDNYLDTTEKYNGVTWVNVSATLNAIKSNHAGVGDSKDAMVCGGRDGSSYFNTTEVYKEKINSIVDLNPNENISVEKDNFDIIKVTTDILSEYTITVESSDTAKMTAEVIDNNNISIKGMAEGTANLTITVTSPRYLTTIITKEITITVPIVRTWSLGPYMLSGRQSHYTIGSVNSCISTGGRYTGGSAYDTVEEFNSISWISTANKLNASRYDHGGVGTIDDAFIYYGSDTADELLLSSEKYDGTTWSTSVVPNVGKNFSYGVGTFSNMITCGGIGASDTLFNTIEKFNGTTWSISDAVLSAAKYGITIQGSPEYFILTGGRDTPNGVLKSTEKYNGLTISTLSATLESARNYLGSIGTANDMIITGGSDASDISLGSTERFNGTVWSNVSVDLLKARNSFGSSGTSSLGLVCGGSEKSAGSSAALKNTEFWREINTFNPNLGVYNPINIFVTADATFALDNSVDVDANYLSHIVEDPETISVDVTDTDTFDEIHLTTLKEGSTSFDITYTRRNYLDSRRTQVVNIAAKLPGRSVWSMAADKLVERRSFATIGETTNAIVTGGSTAHEVSVNDTEKYDGTTWSNLAASLVEPAQQCPGFGTANSALVVYKDKAEQFNGTAWSTSTSVLNTFRHVLTGVGSMTSAIVCGGRDSSDGNNKPLNSTEVFDGTTWSASEATLNATRYNHNTIGIPNNAIVIKGIAYGEYAINSEAFDGTTWSVSPNSSNIANNICGSFGTVNDGIICGGWNILSSAACLIERSANGVWTIDTAKLNNPTSYHSCVGGSENSGLSPAGDYGVSYSLKTERYSVITSIDVVITPEDITVEDKGITVVKVEGSESGITTVATSTDETICKVTVIDNGTIVVEGISEGTTTITITVSKPGFDDTVITKEVTITKKITRGWILLDAKLNTARYVHSCIGSINSSIACGGGISSRSYLSTTESFNGTIWSLLDAKLNIKKGNLSGVGTSNDAMVYGGYDRNNSVYLGDTESFNGTIWTLLDAKLNMTRGNHVSLGTTSDSIVCGGYNKTDKYLNTTEKFNGIAWALLDANMTTFRSSLGGIGISNDAMIYGGSTKTVSLNTTERFNGTVWSTIDTALLSIDRSGVSTIGTTNDATACAGYGGYRDGYVNTTERFNGTTWYILDTNLNINRGMHASVGSSTNAMVCGGYNNTNYEDIILDTTEVYKEIPQLITTIDIMDGLTLEKGSEFIVEIKPDGLDSVVVESSDSSILDILYDNITKQEVILTALEVGTVTITITADEKFHIPSTITRTINVIDISDPIKTCLWILSPAILNTNRDSHVNIGTSSSTMVCGGYDGTSALNSTEIFDGTTWAISEALLGNDRYSHAGVGTSNDAMICGGYAGINALDIAESFDGTAWSILTARMNTARHSHAIAGISNDAMISNGCIGITYEDITYYNTTEKYDGTTWSTSVDFPINPYGLSIGIGSTVNNHLVCTTPTGVLPENENLTIGTYKFDGTIWSTIDATLNTFYGNRSGFGTSDNATICGGHSSKFSPEYSGVTERFNSTVWYISNVIMNIPVGSHACCGTSGVDGLSSGGLSPNRSGATELFKEAAIPKIIDTYPKTMYKSIASKSANKAIDRKYIFSMLLDDDSIAYKYFDIDMPEEYHDKLSFEELPDNFVVSGYEAGTYTFYVQAPVLEGLTQSEWYETTITVLDDTDSDPEPPIYSSDKYVWRNSTINNITNSIMPNKACGTNKLSLVCNGTNLSVFNNEVWETVDSELNQKILMHSQRGSTTNGVIIAGGVNQATDLPISLLTMSYANKTISTLDATLNKPRVMAGDHGNANDMMVSGSISLDTTNELDLYATTDTSTEKFDGTVWSMGANMNVGRIGYYGSGQTNTAIITCGQTYINNGQSNVTGYTEKFDGTVWSVGSRVNVARSFHNECGPSNNTTINGGVKLDYPRYKHTSALSSTELNDGTSWKMLTAELAVGKATHAGCGTGVNAMTTGGTNIPLALMHYSNRDVNDIFLNKPGAIIYNTTEILQNLNEDEELRKMKDVSDKLETLRPFADINIASVQSATVPQFYDYGLIQTDRYDYDGKTTITDSRKQLVLFANGIRFKSLKNRRSLIFRDTMNNLISREEIHPFLLFINDVFIPWSMIEVINNYNNVYLLVSKPNVSEIVNTSVIYIPFNIYYSENGSAKGKTKIFEFDKDGVFVETGGKYIVSMSNDNIFYDVLDSTIGIENIKIEGLKNENKLTIMNLIYFKDKKPVPSIEDYKTDYNIVSIPSEGGKNITVTTLSANINAGRYNLSAVGTSSSTLMAGGQDDTTIGFKTSELFDGTVWSTVTAEMNEPRARHTGMGTSNDAIMCGGTNYITSYGYLSSTEKYDGTTWSIIEGADLLNEITDSHSGVGISNDALLTGGMKSSDGSGYVTTQKFDGTVWSLSGDMTSERRYHTTTGISNNAIVYGGDDGYLSLTTTEKYDGTTWSTISTIGKYSVYAASVGVVNDAIITGGTSRNRSSDDYPVDLDTISLFNGTIWKTVSVTLGSIRNYHTNAGTSSDAIICGGLNDYDYILTTEKLIGETKPYPKQHCKIFYNLKGNSSIDNIYKLNKKEETEEYIKTGDDGFTKDYFLYPYEVDFSMKRSYYDNITKALHDTFFYRMSLMNDVYKDKSNIRSVMYTGQEILDKTVDSKYRIPRRRHLLEDDYVSDDYVMVFVNNILYKYYMDIVYENNFMVMTVIDILPEDKIEFIFIENIDNRIRPMVVTKDEEYTIIDPSTRLEDIRLFSKTAIDPDYYVTNSLGAVQYELGYTITYDDQNRPKVILNVEDYYDQQIMMTSINQFRHVGYNIQEEGISVVLSPDFNFSHDVNRYLVFINGRKIDRDFYKLVFPDATTPINEVAIYMQLAVNVGDRVDVFYMPMELLPFAWENIKVHNGGTGITANPDLIDSKPDPMKHWLSKDLYFIFVNGKKVRPDQMLDYMFDTILFTEDLNTPLPQSIMQYIQEDSYLTKEMFKFSSIVRDLDFRNPEDFNKIEKWVGIMVQGGANLLPSDLVLQSNTDPMIYENLLEEKPVVKEIVRDYWLKTQQASTGGTFIYKYNDIVVEGNDDGGNKLLPLADGDNRENITQENQE